MRKLSWGASLSYFSRWWSTTSVKKKSFEVVFGPILVLAAGAVITNGWLSPNKSRPATAPAVEKVSVIKAERMADSHKPWIQVILRNPTDDEIAVTGAQLIHREGLCESSKIPPGEIYGEPSYLSGPMRIGKVFTFDVNEKVSAHSVDSLRISTRELQDSLDPTCYYKFDLALFVNGESQALSAAKDIAIRP